MIKLKTKSTADGVICSGCDLYDGIYCKMAWGKKHGADVPWMLHPTKKCPLHKTAGTFIIDPFKGHLK
jgi:hypothetical protein